MRQPISLRESFANEKQPEFDYNRFMNAWMIPIVLLSTFQAPIQTEYEFSYGLGTEIPLSDFPFQHPSLVQAIDQIKPGVLGTTTFSINQDAIDYSFKVTFTNEGVIVGPLVGENPFISSFGVNDTHHFISLFNPTLSPLSLDNYQLVINGTDYAFDIGLSIPSMEEKRIPLVDGVSTINVIGDDGVVVLFPVQQISLKEASLLAIDDIAITEVMQVLNQDADISTHAFQRVPYVKDPEASYTSTSWVAVANEEQVPTHTLFQPNVTPLIQAKAWAHYVMFGAGMFAAGRVEEAFRALEKEYEFMDARSQAILFEQPNTSFEGINERDRLDISTFREAVGRYNYLAARVPGAIGLINPNPASFPILALVLIFLGLLGLFALFAIVKSRYQRA
jgi:hypothetical protein